MLPHTALPSSIELPIDCATGAKVAPLVLLTLHLQILGRRRF